MCLGWMFFNAVFYGLLTWMPTYLFKVHGLDIKTLGGASFIIFFSGFVGELVGGWIGDAWRAQRRAAEHRVPHAVRHRGGRRDRVDLLGRLCDGPDRRRGAAVDHAVLPALVRHVLGGSLDPGRTRAVGLPRRLHEPRRQHRRHHGADHRRASSSSVTGSYFLALMFFACGRRRAPRLLDRDRLQPQAARSEAVGKLRSRERGFRHTDEMTESMTSRLGMLTPSSNTVLEPVTARCWRASAGRHGPFLTLQGDGDRAFGSRALGNSTTPRSCVRPNCWRTPRSTSSPGTAPRRAGSASIAMSVSASASRRRRAFRRARRCWRSAKSSTHRSQAHRAGDALSRRRPGQDHRELGCAGPHVRGRTASVGFRTISRLPR